VIPAGLGLIIAVFAQSIDDGVDFCRHPTSRAADRASYLAIAGHEAVGKPIGGREPAAPQGE
jgi:hypothetical protein